MGTWKLVDVDCKRRKSAIAICSFKPLNAYTLGFKIGDRFEIERESKDWYYGCLLNSSAKHGIFPKNYVHLFDKEDLVHADPSVAEIDALLKEWISVWNSKYDECDANKMISLMGYFKNLYNVRNIIIANRASIDEIKDHKKSAIDKILQCNNLLGLDVMAYDSSYNLLDPLKASTIYLFNELKKNSLVKANVINKSVFHPSFASLNEEVYTQFSDVNTTFSHQLSNTNLMMQNGGSVCVRTNSITSRTSINQNQYRLSQSVFYIKLSIENIRPSENVSIDENVQFYVNLFMNKEACYLRKALISNHLSLNDCELPAIINPKILDPKLSLKEQHDMQHQNSKQSKNQSKDVYCTLSFKCELDESTYNELLDKYLRESINRKMSFPDIIMPDDYRNDFYVFLFDGEFNKAKNYEILANLVQFVQENDKLVEEITYLGYTSLDLLQFPMLIILLGLVVQKEISLSDNDDDDLVRESCSQQQQQHSRGLFMYKSLIYAKQDKPKWHEILKISIGNGKKVEKIKNTYLRFLIRTHESMSTSSTLTLTSSSNKNDKIKVYGKCYLKLTNDDGSAIKDEPTLYLPINKIEQDDVESNQANFVRLKTASLPVAVQSITNLVQLQQHCNNKKEYLRIKVNVVSTQLTQNSTLLKLLSFPSDKNPNHLNYKFLQQYLDELLNVKDEQSAEIVKFLQPLFEKLIDILLDLNTKYTQSIITPDLIQKHENDIQPLVFKILISIFQIIDNQNKFASFRNVIDAYLNKHFSITLAHKPLFRLFLLNIGYIYEYFQNYFQRSSTHTTLGDGSFNVNMNDKEDPIINIIKSIEYIFKFSFKSRDLLSMYKNKNNPQSDKIDQFEADVKSIFNLLTQIIKLKNTHQQSTGDNSTDLDLTVSNMQLNHSHLTSSMGHQATTITNIDTYLMKIQSYILKNVINLLPILMDSRRFTNKTIAEFYIGFLCNKFCLNTKFLSKLINSKLFEIQDSRHLIIEPLCRTLSKMILLETIEERHVIDARLESIGRLFTELMDVLERKDIGSVSQDINEICTCLPQLIKVSIYLKNHSTCRQIYATVIISILRVMETKHFQSYFNLAYSAHSDSNSLQLMIYMSASLISDEIYPNDWSDLLVLRDSILLNVLHNIADRISSYHLKDFNQVNKKIWQDYFDAIVALITDSGLQLEKFSDKKRANIVHKYGDMRLRGVLVLKNMWYSLGTNKQHFIPNMIDSFLRVALIPIRQINEEIIPIFFDMISAELYARHQSGQSIDTFDTLIVPNKLVSTLDEHIENGAGTYEFRDVFQAIFTDKFLKNRTLCDHIDYVHKLVDLIDLLIEYRDLQVNDPLHQLKTLYLHELMNFYKNMNRSDLYLKYVDYLRKIHVNSKNNVCAAHTIILHATLLNWSNEIIDVNHLRHTSYPNIKHHRDLKERLYIDIIKYFTNGQAWENAFEFSKFLRERYEVQYDYDKLCEILQRQAELCKNILHKERFYSNYYLVGFYGKQFPKLLQNRQFVFMAGAFEDIGTFRPRIQNWFPQAVLLAHSNAPTDCELNSNSKYMQITKLEPIYKPKTEFANVSLSQKLISYYQSNEVDQFRHSYRKETKLNEADPTMWWVRERTVHITNSLPSVINFYPVKSELLIDISPIQNAINNVRKQYDNLKLYLDEMHEKNHVQDTHIRIIQGTVDAGVNGGLPKYEEFLKATYALDNPDSVDLIDQLKELIFETIDLAETYLLWCIKYLKNNRLLEILEAEQLPKLKAKFRLPTGPNHSKKQLIEQQFDAQQHSGLVENTSTPIRKVSMNDLLSTASSKSNNSKSKQLLFSSSKHTSTSLSGNHRESISSLRSANSDDESNKNNTKMIVLNEQLNPIRPLRPSRINGTQASTSSINVSLSNNSSRPISHISDDGVSQVSLLPENIHSQHDTYYDLINNGAEYIAPSATAPPKPALPQKPLNIQLKLKQTSNQADDRSTDNLSQSLNDVLFTNNQ